VQKSPALVAVPIIIGLIGLFLWKYKKRLAAANLEEKDRVDMELKAWQISIQFAGGAALIFGLYFTSQTLLTSQETLRTTQEGQITERFTKAIEQLGRDNLSMRLGGIYALERIARDSAKDHWPVMEVLTAFVREHAHVKEQPPENAAEEGIAQGHPQERKRACPILGQSGQLPPDIQAILTVLRRRTGRYGTPIREIWPLNLRNTNLQTGIIDNALLDHANLIGTHLQDAYLLGVQLQHADLKGAHLERAELGNALLYAANLTDAYLQDACLLMAELQWAYLIRTHLERADLREADFLGANLWKAHLQGAVLTGAKHLTQDQLNKACIDEKTQLPPHLTPPAPCPVPPPR
jgi:hypothetical protein